MAIKTNLNLSLDPLFVPSTEWVELVRDTWLQCRGPQRVYAKSILDRYDMGRRQRRGQIKHSVSCILLWTLFCILMSMILAGGC